MRENGKSEKIDTITADDFARRFSIRAGNLMWFLGAGASASAGIPTAWQMIWEFKQLLFISQRKVSPTSVADLTNPSVRQQIQSYIDDSGDFPEIGAPDEYAAIFEKVYPSEADRRAYIDSKLSGAKPSFGHLVLATLMKAQLTKLLWTTNFDTLIADAAAKLYESTGPLSVIDLDAPELAGQLISDGRWPIEVKIHGDFRSRRLKNTSEELRHQDTRLRKVFVNACSRYGLIVAGYSGRDDSVMDALDEAAVEPGSFPSGLFWLHRGDGSPLPRVIQLLEKAKDTGIESALVNIENFDEILRDLIRLIEEIDTTVLDAFGSDRRRWTPAPQPCGAKKWPVVRLNAIPVSQFPNVCRRVECNIAGYSEVFDAIQDADVNVIAARVRAGVICFGADSDVRAAFEKNEISEFDLHTIEKKRLRYDSGERGLLRSAMSAALSRERNFKIIRKRNLDFLAPINPQHSNFLKLKSLVGDMSGNIEGYPELKWVEGIGVRLEWANDELWLLIEPHTVFDEFEEAEKSIVADFSRERRVKRYNKQLNSILDFWVEYLTKGGNEIRALGIADGVDAVFKLSKVTAFSRRSMA